jgi:hypothetical protein
MRTFESPAARYAAHGVDVTPAWRDRVGRALMSVAAAGAVVAFVGSIGAVQAAGPETASVETWRLFGLLVFAGMFALLAARPRASAGLWELALFHKAAMAIASLFLAGAREAVSAGAVDAVLAILIAVAYVLTRGWMAWRRR